MFDWWKNLSDAEKIGMSTLLVTTATLIITTLNVIFEKPQATAAWIQIEEARAKLEGRGR